MSSFSDRLVVGKACRGLYCRSLSNPSWRSSFDPDVVFLAVGDGEGAESADERDKGTDMHARRDQRPKTSP